MASSGQGSVWQDHRRAILLGLGGMYITWVVGLWNTAASSLAKNWLILLAVTIPGLIFGVVLAAQTLPSQFSPSEHNSEAGAGSRALDRAVGFLQGLPDWMKGFAAICAVLITTGAVCGLILGGLFDDIRVGLLINNYAHPGRSLVFAGIALGSVYGILVWRDADEWRGWVAIPASAASIVGIGLGVRHFTGVEAEASSIVQDIQTAGTRVTASGYGALARAINDGSTPTPTFVGWNRFRDIRALTIEQLNADPRGWEGSSLAFEGSVSRSSVHVVRDIDTQQYRKELWTLTDGSGKRIRVLRWGAIERSTPDCQRMLVVGQILLRADRIDGTNTILADRWECDDHVTGPTTPYNSQPGYWVAVDSFEGEISQDTLQQLSNTYRLLVPGAPYIVGDRYFDWRSQPDGSVIFIGPFANRNDADAICPELEMFSSGTEICFPVDYVDSDGHPISWYIKPDDVVAQA